MIPPAFNSIGPQVEQRDAIPVAPCCRPEVKTAERTRLGRLAERLLLDEPALSSSRYFGPLVRQGAGVGPGLLIGDQHEMSLYENSALSLLEYRMALLAQPGDVVAVSSRDRAFERYLCDYLGLRNIRYVEAGVQTNRGFVPVSVHCRSDPHIFAVLQEVAVDGGGLVLLPYICTGNVWRLSQKIADTTGCPAQICGPAPRLTKRVNNKVWFANRVRAILGEHALPPTSAAYGPAAAAARIRRLARQADRVVVKVPDSAGSLGNIALDSKDIADLPLRDLQRTLHQLLRNTGWRERFPVLVGVWEGDVVSSPSVQLWIPLPEHGEPLIEGIFEQRVRGAGGKFVGASRAELEPGLEARLANEAARMAFVFQNIGYFGRCSFDCVITAPDGLPQQVHWIECNGRWGGVSIPMTLAMRLTGSGNTEGFVVVQQAEPDLAAQTTSQVVKRLSDLLFVHGSSQSGIVLLAPQQHANDSGMYFMAIASEKSEAVQLADAAMRAMR